VTVLVALRPLSRFGAEADFNARTVFLPPTAPPPRQNAPDSRQGFDEFMNVVLDQAAEVSVKGGSRTELGTPPLVPRSQPDLA
jgi:hypothetical protein